MKCWKEELVKAIDQMRELQQKYDSYQFDSIGGSNYDRMERVHKWFDDYVHDRISWPIRDEDEQCSIIDKMEHASLTLQHTLSYLPDIELGEEIIALHNWFHENLCSPPYDPVTGMDAPKEKWSEYPPSTPIDKERDEGHGGGDEE